jgi:hypothetical protein
MASVNPLPVWFLCFFFFFFLSATTLKRKAGTEIASVRDGMTRRITPRQNFDRAASLRPKRSARDTSRPLQRAGWLGRKRALGRGVPLGERRFPPGRPGASERASALESGSPALGERERERARERALSSPPPSLLNPPTYFLRLHTQQL